MWVVVALQLLLLAGYGPLCAAQTVEATATLYDDLDPGLQHCPNHPETHSLCPLTQCPMCLPPCMACVGEYDNVVLCGSSATPPLLSLPCSSLSVRWNVTVYRGGSLTLLYMNVDDFNSRNFSAYDPSHSCLNITRVTPCLQNWFDVGDGPDKMGLLINDVPHSPDVYFVAELDIGYSTDVLSDVSHLATWIIIVIAVGGAALLLCCCCGTYYRCCGRGGRYSSHHVSNVTVINQVASPSPPQTVALTVLTPTQVSMGSDVEPPVMYSRPQAHPQAYKAAPPLPARPLRTSDPYASQY